MSSDCIDRLPTLQELDAGYNLQVMQDAQRAAKHQPRPMTEAEAMLREVGELTDERPALPERVGCTVCGKLFTQYKTVGMAKLQRAKHEKREHPEMVRAF